MKKERIKDYRRLNLRVQNYFRGNTAARCRRIRDIQKRIYFKRFHLGMQSLFSMMDNGAL